MTRRRLSVPEYIEGILKGDRVVLSRAITLIESTLPADAQLAEEIINQLLPYTGKSKRVGITGVPGVGKSTFIESVGMHLVNNDHKVAVLAVDPSSQRSKGSILGDKTRMEELSHHPNAFIRPSATGSSLGGVANNTRETMLLCEAAGYNVILIETVGVGQSEVAVKGMVDFFLLLMLAGAGDELQGIKKGIMEMADAIAITKVDGDNTVEPLKAMSAYKNALHLFPPHDFGWRPDVLTCSALTNTGIDDTWSMIESYYIHMEQSLGTLRERQNLDWMHELIRGKIAERFYGREGMENQLMEMEGLIKKGQITPQGAVRRLLE